MILLDVSVVLAAHRADHPQHRTVRTWFDEMLTGRQQFAVPDEVWASFVRVATNRRIFPVPTPVSDAFAFVRSVRAQPAHSVLRSGPRRLELFEQLCIEGQASGDLVPDAFLAALAIENGCVLASLDRDFARFSNLEWQRPGAP